MFCCWFRIRFKHFGSLLIKILGFRTKNQSFRIISINFGPETINFGPFRIWRLAYRVKNLHFGLKGCISDQNSTISDKTVEFRTRSVSFRIRKWLISDQSVTLRIWLVHFGQKGVHFGKSSPFRTIPDKHHHSWPFRTFSDHFGRGGIFLGLRKKNFTVPRLENYPQLNWTNRLHRWNPWIFRTKKKTLENPERGFRHYISLES